MRGAISKSEIESLSQPISGWTLVWPDWGAGWLDQWNLLRAVGRLPDRACLIRWAEAFACGSHYPGSGHSWPSGLAPTVCLAGLDSTA